MGQGTLTLHRWRTRLLSCRTLSARTQSSTDGAVRRMIRVSSVGSKRKKNPTALGSLQHSEGGQGGTWPGRREAAPRGARVEGAAPKGTGC